MALGWCNHSRFLTSKVAVRPSRIPSNDPRVGWWLVAGTKYNLTPMLLIHCHKASINSHSFCRCVYRSTLRGPLQDSARHPCDMLFETVPLFSGVSNSGCGGIRTRQKIHRFRSKTSTRYVIMFQSIYLAWFLWLHNVDVNAWRIAGTWCVHV